MVKTKGVLINCSSDNGRVLPCALSICFSQAGRLLIRRLIADKLKIPWHEIQLQRTARGKPVLASDLSSIYARFNFNISHQGNYAVLAAEPFHQVGIDIMKTSLPGGVFLVANAFFLLGQFVHVLVI